MAGNEKENLQDSFEKAFNRESSSLPLSSSSEASLHVDRQGSVRRWVVKGTQDRAYSVALSVANSTYSLLSSFWSRLSPAFISLFPEWGGYLVGMVERFLREIQPFRAEALGRAMHLLVSQSKKITFSEEGRRWRRALRRGVTAATGALTSQEMREFYVSLVQVLVRALQLLGSEEARRLSDSILMSVHALLRAVTAEEMREVICKLGELSEAGASLLSSPGMGEALGDAARQLDRYLAAEHEFWERKKREKEWAEMSKVLMEEEGGEEEVKTLDDLAKGGVRRRRRKESMLLEANLEGTEDIQLNEEPLSDLSEKKSKSEKIIKNQKKWVQEGRWKGESESAYSGNFLENFNFRSAAEKENVSFRTLVGGMAFLGIFFVFIVVLQIFILMRN